MGAGRDRTARRSWRSTAGQPPTSRTPRRGRWRPASRLAPGRRSRRSASPAPRRGIASNLETERPRTRRRRCLGLAARRARPRLPSLTQQVRRAAQTRLSSWQQGHRRLTAAAATPAPRCPTSALARPPPTTPQQAALTRQPARPAASHSSSPIEPRLVRTSLGTCSLRMPSRSLSPPPPPRLSHPPARAHMIRHACI